MSSTYKPDGTEPTYTDDLELRYAEACEERDHLRAVLAGRATVRASKLYQISKPGQKTFSTPSKGMADDYRADGWDVADFPATSEASAIPQASTWENSQNQQKGKS